MTIVAVASVLPVLLHVLMCATTTCAAAASASLGLAVGRNGSFAITHDGEPWIQSTGQVMLGGSAAVLVGAPVNSDGTDALGSYTRTTLQWKQQAASGSASADHAATTMQLQASFRVYNADPSTILFEQRFPSAVTLSMPPHSDSVGQGPVSVMSTSTLFPSFDRGRFGKAGTLDCFSFIGAASYGFPSLVPANTSTYAPSVGGGVPLVFYDGHNKSLPASVFSPVNHPLAAHMGSTEEVFGAGVKAGVDIIPQGWSQLFMLHAGSGISSTMMGWGDRLLQFKSKENSGSDSIYGSDRTDLYGNDILSTIGFWTSNGGYYHYANFTNATGMGGSTYEEVPCRRIRLSMMSCCTITPPKSPCRPIPCYRADATSLSARTQVLPKVHAEHRRAGLHFGHWQYDSWWYAQEHITTSAPLFQTSANHLDLRCVLHPAPAGLECRIKPLTPFHLTVS